MFAFLLFIGKIFPVENEPFPCGNDVSPRRNEAFPVENIVQHIKFAPGYDRLTMCLIALTSFHCMFTLSLSRSDLM